MYSNYLIAGKAVTERSKRNAGKGEDEGGDREGKSRILIIKK